jgi:ribonuclease HI
VEYSVVAYTDGSGHHQSRFGGWGAVVELDRKVAALFGGVSDFTTNRLEMVGPLMAMQYLAHVGVTGQRVQINSDSQYLVRGMNEWVIGWKAMNWKTHAGQSVKNKDLWIDLLLAVTALRQGKNEVDFEWLPAHAGIEGNENADKLANLGRLMLRNEQAQEKSWGHGSHVSAGLLDFEPSWQPSSEYVRQFRWTIAA